jgi:hypothetical protein
VGAADGSAMAVYPEVPLIEMIDILEYLTGIGSACASPEYEGARPDQDAG